MKIFLLEDDYLLNKAITQYLTGKGFEITSFFNGGEALNAITDDYAMIILDIDIPELSGIVVMEEIRKLYPTKPIIMISATTDFEVISKAYVKGCNDYMKKPFDIRELELKIRAYTQLSVDTFTIMEGLEYTKSEQRLLYHSLEIVLTPKEKKLFHILVENKGHTVAMEHLERTIWGMNGDAVHLRQLIARLRKKLPENTIENRTGSGYCIV